MTLRFWRILFSEGPWALKTGCCLQLRPHGLMVQSPLFKAACDEPIMCKLKFSSCSLFGVCVFRGKGIIIMHVEVEYTAWNVECEVVVCYFVLFFPPLVEIWSSPLAFLFLWRSCIWHVWCYSQGRRLHLVTIKSPWFLCDKWIPHALG